MILRSRLHWLRMLFVWRGSVLPRILPQLSVVTLLSCVAVLDNGVFFHWKLNLTPTVFSLVGVSLAIFLGFRIRASYDRFWEARKQWGALINHSRAIVRQAISLTPRDEAEHCARLQIALVHCLRHQLRRTDPAEDLARLLEAEEVARVHGAAYRPAMLLLMLGEWLARMRREQGVEAILAARFEASLNGVADVIGGCERLASTPIPFPYSVILHRTAYGYCFLMPFGLLGSIGWMAPVITLLVSYSFLALEELSHELEEPFGMEPNDLPLDALSRNIERALRDMLGERELPPLLEAQAFVLH